MGKRVFDEYHTIILFFDFEFYVPESDRTGKGFKANPYKESHFLLGGTFIRYYPLCEKNKSEMKQYWIWNYENEKYMLIDILNFLKETWSFAEDDTIKQDVMACGIGIGRVDIPYFLGRCIENNITTKENLFSNINRLRIIDLENVAIPFFRSQSEFIYTKSTEEINKQFIIDSEKRQSGKKVWVHYDHESYDAIIERNEKEVKDLLRVYKIITRFSISKYIKKQYAKETFEEIVGFVKNKDEKNLVNEYYELNKENTHYILKPIDFDMDSGLVKRIEIKYNLMKIMDGAYNLSKMK